MTLVPTKIHVAIPTSIDQHTVGPLNGPPAQRHQMALRWWDDGRPFSMLTTIIFVPLYVFGRVSDTYASGRKFESHKQRGVVSYNNFIVPTMWYVRLAKAQTSLLIRAV